MTPNDDAANDTIMLGIRNSHSYLVSVSLALLAATACGSDDGGAGGGASSGGDAGTDGGGGSATGGSAGIDGGGGSSAGDGGGTAGSAGVGGSGGSAGGGGAAGSSGLSCDQHASATAAEACNSYATAYCDLLVKCAPSSLARLRVASESDCVTTLDATCHMVVEAPGSNEKPAGVATIADLISSETCTDFYTGSLSAVRLDEPSCGAPGTLADGDTCYSDSQCQGSHCSVQSGELCGQCTSKVSVGGACTYTPECVDSAYCDSSDHCVTRPKLGDSCAGGATCEAGAYCDTGDVCVAVGGDGAGCDYDGECESPLVCGGSGQCRQAAFGALGDTCEPYETSSCNHWLGLVCDLNTRKCIAEPVPGPGDTCGVMDVGGRPRNINFCSGGASCVIPSGSDTGTCVVVADVGGSCDLEAGPGCVLYAECISGTCQVADATTCAP